MKDELISLLTEEFHFPVFLQGTLNANAEYPESFFTIWNDSTDGAAWYDNDAHSFVWAFTVYFYSTDASRVNTIMPEVRQLLREHGWIVPGLGGDASSDEPSHTGKEIDVLYIENNQTGG